MHARLTSVELLRCAQQVLHTEAAALTTLAEQLDDHFAQAVGILLNCRSKVVVTGMGKSGHIGRKIAATLASTGTAAFFVHPAEAAHGDLGMLDSADVILALSYSGESDEVVRLLPALKRRAIPIVAITGRAQSTLARAADLHLALHVHTEACPLGLAPTTSTTATLALGDALAVALMESRGFDQEDFAYCHPAGALGRRLLLRVADVMRHGEQLPVVTPNTCVSDALLVMTRKGLGLVLVCDAASTKQLLGIYTDGDLRRTLNRGEANIRALTLAEVMTTTPHSIVPEALASAALQQMEQHRIQALVVSTDGKNVQGVIHVQDLLRAGVV